MLTTVVGSYPALPKEPSSISEKISNLFGTYDEYKPAIELAVRDQIEAGIDIISDGQVREGMVEIFASAIPGMAVEDKTPKIVGKIMSPYGSIGADDLKFAKKIAEGISKEYGRNSNKKLEDGVKGVKGIITGPSTLVFSSRMEGFYKNKEDAIIDLACALKNEAGYLEEAGAIYIQIDEPFISTGVVDMDTAKNAIEIINKGLSIPVGLHVCGDVTAVFNELLKFDVDVIDCEFAGILKNMQVLEDINLNGKKIGFGCLDTKTDKIEIREEVEELIKKAIDLIGFENLIIDPDCGMRMRSRDAAFAKLKVMTEAAKNL
ncbi:MAG: methionine synthase [Methanobacterium sp.]|uniref:methionine synthase n=1 Tax=Methanobacterium sp. TaxID=2164 RepID=UPI003D6543B3|nr:methionine synthase [Methanobacterium sp.]